MHETTPLIPPADIPAARDTFAAVQIGETFVLPDAPARRYTKVAPDAATYEVGAEALVERFPDAQRTVAAVHALNPERRAVLDRMLIISPAMQEHDVQCQILASGYLAQHRHDAQRVQKARHDDDC